MKISTYVSTKADITCDLLYEFIRNCARAGQPDRQRRVRLNLKPDATTCSEPCLLNKRLYSHA